MPPNSHHDPQFVLLCLNVSNQSVFFTALCTTISLFFLPVKEHWYLFFSFFFSVASWWLNGSLLFASIHGDSLTLTAKVLLGLWCVRRSLIRSEALHLSFHLSASSCLHVLLFLPMSATLGFPTVSIALQASLSHSSHSFVVYCFKFISFPHPISPVCFFCFFF